MTQEDKLLLIKDLCARLPYGVKLNANYIDFERIGKLFSINNNEELILLPDNGYPFDIIIEKCKPYLFPTSSMTEEQKKEFNSYFASVPYYGDNIHIPYYFVESLIDFYNKHHFDWRGLIPKGLAIDATGLNIY